MKLKMFVISILLLILLIGCAKNIEVDRDPDFESRFIPHYKEDETAWLAMVNDNMTKEAREHLKLPNEWEVYYIKLDKDTRYIDENEKGITKEDFEKHDYKYKVWTREKFKPQWSKVVTEGDSRQLKIDHYPKYTAVQIQLVQMTDEEYLALNYANREGSYVLQIYLGEMYNNSEDMNSYLQTNIWEHIDMEQYNINSISFSKAPSERKKSLLDINKYPVIILFDHEKLLLKTYDEEELYEFLDDM